MADKIQENVDLLARILDLLYNEIPLNNIAIQSASQHLANTTTTLLISTFIILLTFITYSNFKKSAPRPSLAGVFQPCSDPFFAALPACTVTVGPSPDFLHFGHPIPLMPTHDCLFVRESYEEIANSATLNLNKNLRRYVVISGSPGIGKSVFLFYLFWHLIQSHQRVLFLRSEGPSIYFDGQSIFECDQLPQSSNSEFWSTDLWCLVDSRNPTTIPGIPIRKCSIILVTSPRKDYTSDFMKLVPKPAVFYMPLWNQIELQAISGQYPLAVNWMDRFQILGGIPRTVMEDISLDPLAVLVSACTQCSLEDCIRAISLQSTITERIKGSQTLIHIQAQSPFDVITNQYASHAAMDTISQRLIAWDKAKIQSLFSSSAVNPLAATLCGYIWVPYAINRLAEGGDFECRQLVTGRVNKSKIVINIPKSIQPPLVVEKVARDQKVNQLHVPKTPNYAKIDAWIPGVGGFQMTVGKSHDIKGGADVDLENLGSLANKLYFVVTPYHFGSFKRQSTTHDFTQYVLVIPYPDVHGLSA